jgi:hypothetical protein
MNASHKFKASTQKAIAHLHGRLEVQIEYYAAGIGISPAELSNELGSLLLTNSTGSVSDRVRVLREKAPGLLQGSTEMEVGSRTRKGRPRGKVGRPVGSKNKKPRGVHGAFEDRNKRKRISGIKAYWAAMTEDQRKKEMKRRGLVKNTIITKKKKSGIKAYWDAMTPDQRKAENARRRAMRKITAA